MIRQTSINVYHEIRDNGLLSKLRFTVYEALFKHGPMTQMELCHLLRGDKYSYDRQSLTPRFAELLDAGVIKDVGKRKCSITGNEVLVWDVTDRLPKKVTRLFSRKKDPDAIKILKLIKRDISSAFLGTSLTAMIDQYLDLDNE